MATTTQVILHPLESFEEESKESVVELEFFWNSLSFSVRLSVFWFVSLSVWFNVLPYWLIEWLSSAAYFE